MLLILFLWAFLLEHSQGSKLPIFHRIFTPDTDTQWTLRGHIEEERWAPVPNLNEDFHHLLTGSFSSHPDGLYQIALGDFLERHWSGLAMASVAACNLKTGFAEHFTILSSNHSAYGLSYAITPTSPDGLCKDTVHRSPQNLTTTINILTTTKPPRATLRTPPPLNPQGQVIQPPPEKTFLQKYWMYFAILFLVISMAGGGDDNRNAAA